MKRLAVTGLHIAYWGLYFLLLLLFASIAWHTAHDSFRGFLHAVIFSPVAIFTALPAIATFYIFYSILFPRLLQHKRLFLLGLSGAAVSSGSSLLIFVAMSRLLFPWLNQGFSRDTGTLILILSFISFVNGVLALVMRGFIAWYSDIQFKKDLKQKNAELELALIKSQLSPHFLFNTLNNIDVLIEREPARASNYLNKLSDLLRFMLYETKTDRIAITKELRYIKKYIELQQLRTAHPEFIYFEVEGENAQLMVEPMLFLPFIENAFKHAGKKEDGAIRIRFTFNNGQVTFDCENRYDPKTPTLPDAGGGLGNELIRKRLQLLYPGRHTLQVNAGRDNYKATLTLMSHAN
jgi:two-component system, LytTR family, sensor kinase